MVHNLSEIPTLLHHFLAEIRDEKIQKDAMRFRRNLERIGEIMAYEISKKLTYKSTEINTPLGKAYQKICSEKIVLGTILRAGLPLHQGLLNYFDKAENAFVSAYRKHHKDGDFKIQIEYKASPSLKGKTLILSDTMLATGASMLLTYKALVKHHKPDSIHIVTAIASREGIDSLKKNLPSNVTIWAGTIDDEMTAQAYIVPGLGDAGDLAYGVKD